jgi:hypothetical protein
LPPPLQDAIRPDELRRWSAELMCPGTAGLFLHGITGIGKSVLAAQIAGRISAGQPGTQVTTITGTLTVEQVAGILVADHPTLVVFDQFEANVSEGRVTDRGLAAVLMCLAEEITGREDQGRQARIIVTAGQPLTLGPRILIRHVGPLTRWSTDEFARSLPRLSQLTGAERDYAWRLTAGHPGRLRTLDARLAEATFAELADRLAREIAARTSLPADRIFPTELDPAAAAAVAAAAGAALDPPRVAAPASESDEPTGPDAPDDSKRRFPGLRVLSATVAVAAIAWAPFAVKPLLASITSATAHVSHPASHEPRAVLAVKSPPTPQASAASWLAGNMTGGTLIGCDPVMCASLSQQGVATADLSPLRPGGDLTADGLIVATPQARTLMGSAIATAAPELIASFGGGQVQVREVTPGGAAGYYSSLLAADLTSRREAGGLILGNPDITASGGTPALLRSGQVDSRILLSLAEIAHSEPLTIVSFGAASPGAAPEVPMRSVLIDVADPAMAAACLKVQDPAMQPLAVRTGQASLWVEFGAPIPLGLFQAKS